mmetsp:Transcript_19822/g.36073  ORF Transcript_19822/g.36073 Transcript_19822/m.36073 type:complete len:108 (+) Transcript_19822:1063-1386(+)
MMKNASWNQEEGKHNSFPPASGSLANLFAPIIRFALSFACCSSIRHCKSTEYQIPLLATHNHLLQKLPKLLHPTSFRRLQFHLTQMIVKLVQDQTKTPRKRRIDDHK